MKNISVLLAVSMLSTSALAFVMPDGSAATVLREAGSTTAYVKEAKAGTDGSVTLLQGQVFDGERLVKQSNGQCLMVRERLVRLETVTVGDFNIQRPITTIDLTSASCGS